MATKPSRRRSSNTDEDDESGKQRVITPTGRLCFPALWEPRAFNNQPARYSAVIVFPDASELRELKLACVAAAESKWGAKARALLKSGKLRRPWRDGDEYGEYGEPFTDEGAVFISPKSNTAPGIVNARAKPVIDQNDVYPGCFVRVSVYAFPYDQSGNRGVGLLLNNVQKVKDGQRLDGRRSAEEEFDAIEGASDDDDDDIF